VHGIERNVETSACVRQLVADPLQGPLQLEEPDQAMRLLRRLRIEGRPGSDALVRAEQASAYLVHPVADRLGEA
jgi:hypothetical protein